METTALNTTQSSNLLTVDEVAKKAGVCRRTVHNWATVGVCNIRLRKRHRRNCRLIGFLWEDVLEFKRLGGTPPRLLHLTKHAARCRMQWGFSPVPRSTLARRGWFKGLVPLRRGFSRATS